MTPMEKAMRAAVAVEVEQLRKNSVPEEKIKRFVEDRERYIKLTLEHVHAPKQKREIKIAPRKPGHH